MLESAKTLFSSRDDAESRMKYLKEKAERDRIVFNAEYKDVMRIIDHDKKMRDFMTTKNRDLSQIHAKTARAG